jgi:hypothetical protein
MQKYMRAEKVSAIKKVFWGISLLSVCYIYLADITFPSVIKDNLSNYVLNPKNYFDLQKFNS